jgi:hypothetical protein
LTYQHAFGGSIVMCQMMDDVALKRRLSILVASDALTVHLIAICISSLLLLEGCLLLSLVFQMLTASMDIMGKVIADIGIM